jgi:hypothetical protein
MNQLPKEQEDQELAKLNGSGDEDAHAEDNDLANETKPHPAESNSTEPVTSTEQTEQLPEILRVDYFGDAVSQQKITVDGCVL